MSGKTLEAVAVGGGGVIALTIGLALIYYAHKNKKTMFHDYGMLSVVPGLGAIGFGLILGFVA